MQPTLKPIKMKPNKALQGDVRVLPAVRFDQLQSSIFYTPGSDPYAPSGMNKQYEITNVIAPNLLGETIPKWSKKYTGKPQQPEMTEQEYAPW
jgi:hypothetical protein